MLYDLGVARLRKPEVADIEALYVFKNDPAIAALLGGFTKGYSRANLAQWVRTHSEARDEALYVIAGDDDKCLGHVGLYKIDHRIRAAEFGIVIGDRSAWGAGIGRACTKFMLRFGFEELRLHRIYLEVLESNERACRLYEAIGFRHEGTLRHAQWKGGSWHDIRVMGILEDEWRMHDR